MNIRRHKLVTLAKTAISHLRDLLDAVIAAGKPLCNGKHNSFDGAKLRKTIQLEICYECYIINLMNILRKTYESVVTHPVAWAVGSVAAAGVVWGGAEVAQWVNDAFVNGNGIAPDGSAFDVNVVNS